MKIRALIILIILSYGYLSKASRDHDDDRYDSRYNRYGRGHGYSYGNSHWSYDLYPPNWVYDGYYNHQKGKKNWFCGADEFWPLSKLRNGSIVENIYGRYDGKAKHHASVLWPCPPQPGGIGIDGHSWVHLGEYNNECLGNLSLCSNGLTVSLWIKMIISYGRHNDGYYVSAGGLKDFFRIALFSGKHPYFIASVGNFIYYSTIPSRIIGKWAHILFTFNGHEKFRLYINTKESEINRYRYSPSHYNFTKFYLGRSIHHKTTTSAKFSQIAVWYHKLNWHDICTVYLGSRKTLKHCQEWYKDIKCDKETSSIIEQPSMTSMVPVVSSLDNVEASSIKSSSLITSSIESTSPIASSAASSGLISSILTSSDVEKTSSLASSTSSSTFIVSRSVSTVSSRRVTTTRIESLAVSSTPVEISVIEPSEFIEPSTINAEKGEISSFEFLNSKVSSDTDSTFIERESTAAVTSSLELTSEISSIMETSSIVEASSISLLFTSSLSVNSEIMSSSTIIESTSGISSVLVSKSIMKSEFEPSALPSPSILESTFESNALSSTSTMESEFESLEIASSEGKEEIMTSTENSILEINTTVLATSRPTIKSTTSVAIIESTISIPIIESTKSRSIIESTKSRSNIESTTPIPLIESTLSSFLDIESFSTEPVEFLSSICIHSTKTIYATITTSRTVVSCPPSIETLTRTAEELVFTCPSVCQNVDIRTTLPHM